MLINRTISLFAKKVYNKTNNGEAQIRMRVKWKG